MVGILDYLTGNNAAASPWGALYDQPAAGANPQDLAAIYAAAGIDPATVQQPSVFGDPSKYSVANPNPPPPPVNGFGAGASPFGFAGPGSNTISPAALAPPAAPPVAPQVAQPQATPTDLSSVNRPAPSPTAADDGPDSVVPVGNYKMPVFGEAPDDEDAIPAAAKPTAGTLPTAAPAPAAPFSLAGTGDAVGDRLMKGARGFMGNMATGPVGALMGGLGALVTGKNTDPTSIANEKLNMTGQALLKKGVAPEIVQAALVNPEVMKTLIAQNFGPDKFQHVTVKNADGSESPQAFDPSTGKYSGAAPQAPSKFSVDPELTGQARLDALKAVDPLYARKIESLVAGDLPMPTGVAALRPESKRMIEDALAVDGSTSASDFQTRASTRKDYASGIASRVTKSINTTIGHFATLDQAVDKLGNYSYFPKITNAVHDAYSSNMDPKYQQAKATFETNKEAAVKELDFALSGGHSSVSGSAELRDKFNRADSPEALHAAITEAMSLLQKRLESHTKAFTEGTKSQRDPQDFIYPENQQAFGRMLHQPGASASGPSSAPGTPPPPGNYVWTPSGGLAGAK